MHYCLLISEIILEVVDALTPDAEERVHPNVQKFSAEKATLAAMARTCKAFYEPSMNALWKVVVSLGCITQCLPLSVAPDKCNERQLERFFTNTARILYFRLPREGTYMDKEGLGSSHHLSLIRAYIGPRRNFLPNLKVLVAAPLPENEMEHAPDMLFGPRLKKLRILCRDQNTTETLMLHASRSCLDVRMLEVLHWAPSFDPILVQLENLEHFKYHLETRLPEATILSLAALPNLRDLHILPPYISNPPPAHPLSSFASLKTLTLSEIQEGDLTSVSMFLSYASLTRLLQLDLQFDVDSRNYAQFNRVLEVVGENLSSLQTLSLSGWGPDTTRETEKCNLRPLMRLRCLRGLSLRVVGMSDQITNQTIPTFSAAWPNLTQFSFLQSPCYRMKPGNLTLESLGLFAQHFPNLSQLVLELDATRLAPNITHLSCSTKPLEIDLWGSLIDDKCLPRVAAYIAGTYPNCTIGRIITPVPTPTTRRGEEHAQWQRVADMITTFAKMSEEQRSWAVEELSPV